jgi:CRP-like cAMP-binding protein
LLRRITTSARTLNIQKWKATAAMRSPHNPEQNHLLEALPKPEFDRIASRLELVPLRLGEVLYPSGGHQRFGHFPTTAIVSVLHELHTGDRAEIAMIGNEGMTGVSLCLGGDTTPNQVMVQSTGYAYRLPAVLLKQEFNREGGGAMMTLLLRYIQSLITQMSQTAVCNRHHNMEQRLCRWLLLRLDRMSTNELNVTQEHIAYMLGVRRESITTATGPLQSDGLVHHSRGRIRVLDRPRLEARVCECYAVVKKEYDRLLPNKVGHLGVNIQGHVPAFG